MKSAPRENRDAFCPSCDRYIGPAVVCPYCDADSARGSALRRLRLAAVALAVVGLAFLYLMAARRDLPLTQVRRMTPMMNFAHVRVSGSVERNAYVSRRDGQVDYVSFPVHDGTGRLRVAAYRQVAQALAAASRLPEKGMRIEAAGVLRVAANNEIRLELRKAEDLRISPSR